MEKILPHVEDTDARPKVSVVLRCRNEYPVILGTIHSFLEDLEYYDYPIEFVVVSNLSDDSTFEILEDRFRRWTRTGLMKVVRYDERPSTWCAANAGIKASTGEVVAVADAHVSLKTGTMHGLVQGALTHGGIWHAAVNKWGDIDKIRTYGYDLTLLRNFWGNPCLHIPPGVRDEDGRPRSHAVAMMGACLLVVRRDEIEKFGAYHHQFGVYGGGEPYLDLKWWLMGSAVYCYPEGLCRHAFGWRAQWQKVKRDKVAKRTIYKKDGKFCRDLKRGDEYLKFGKGYVRPDAEMYRNFMIAAYTLGGDAWLDHVRRQFQEKSRKLRDEIEKIAGRVTKESVAERQFILGHQKLTFDQLLANPPWVHCGRHAKENYSTLRK